MASELQIEANRRNSRRSMGPKTAVGKAKVGRNAIKAGIFAQVCVLPSEDGGEFARLARGLRIDLNPQGALEQTLVDLVVAVAWRLRRVGVAEAGVWEMYRYYQGKERHLATGFAHDAANMGCIGLLSRYEATLTNKLFRLLHELERLQARRVGAPVAPPAVVDVTVTAAPAEGTR